MNTLSPISYLTIVPLLGAIAVLILGPKNKKLSRGLALTFAFLALAIASGFMASLQPGLRRPSV